MDTLRRKLTQHHCCPAGRGEVRPLRLPHVRRQVVRKALAADVGLHVHICARTADTFSCRNNYMAPTYLHGRLLYACSVHVFCTFL